MGHPPILSDSGTLMHFMNNFVSTQSNKLERGHMTMKLMHKLSLIFALRLMQMLPSGILMMNLKTTVTPLMNLKITVSPMTKP
jgi:membrane protein CcdC involved in cytochrome C biogenesis